MIKLIVISLILLIPAIEILYKSIRKSKGCLDGKTGQQKEDFFESLHKFKTTDKMFFDEQYWDLRHHEKIEYQNWVKIKKENN